MPATYEPIATTTLGSAAATITFSSVPNTYTDLRLILNWSGTNVSSSVLPLLRFNSDTSTLYSSTFIFANGSTASSTVSPNDISIKLAGNVYPSSPTIPALTIVDIFSYAGSTFKTILATTSADNNGSGFQFDGVGIYRSTNVVNTINIVLNGNGNYAIGTTATLYGIKNA
jgi:hypothetical protein